MPDDDLFSRDEVLGGRVSRGDVRRARSLVYLIEQEAKRSADLQHGLATVGTSAAMGVTVDLAHLVDAEVLSGPLPGEGDDAYVASFRAARRSAESPELAEIERYHDSWSVLLPQRLDLRARVLMVLAGRYELSRKRCKHLCAAFGVDDPAFAQAYERVAGSPLAEAFVEPKGLFGRRSKRGG